MGKYLKSFLEMENDKILSSIFFPTLEQHDFPVALCPLLRIHFLQLFFLRSWGVTFYVFFPGIEHEFPSIVFSDAKIHY
jgi:hypothetical protein